ncbi:MAG: hypothetical protein ACJ790_22420 [Myxococcaceae bacterium]
MTRLRRPLLAAAIVAIVFACSESLTQSDAGPQPGETTDAGRDGGTSGTDGGLTFQNACALINQKKCEYLQHCGLIASGQAAVRDCASILVNTECGPTLWPARVAVGTLRFNPIIASACAAAYDPSTRDCEDYAQTPSLCDQFLSAGSSLNASCYGGIWRECASGVCRGLSCPRTCRAPGAVGEDCSADGECSADAGLYCLPSGAGTSGACTSFGSVDAGCSALTRCQTGLFCNGVGHCQPLRQSGESCTDGTCVISQWCASTPDGGVCTPRSDNGPCSDDRMCREGFVCVPQSQSCGSRGPIPSGSPCGSGQSCANGFSCVGVTTTTLGACGSPLPEGQGCVGDRDCRNDLSCLPADGSVDLRCAQRQDDGKPCSQDRDCQLYSACKGGSCFRLPRLGEACTGNECVFGSCTPVNDGGSMCTGLLPPNATCSFDAECSSARCAAGTCLAACAP